MNPNRRFRLLKLVLKYDLYTRQFIRWERRTVEHVVPSSVLPTVQSKKDTRNLFVVDASINRFRSDYRFGGSFEEILTNAKDWEHLSFTVFRNQKKRIFFPLHGRRIVANVCLDMMRTYPVLYDQMDRIMVHDDMRQWYQEHFDDTDRFVMFLKSNFSH